MTEYEKFLQDKQIKQSIHGFEPVFLPDGLFDFQKHMVTWVIRQGRGALLEGCGLGKGYQLLVCAENIVRKTNKKTLIVAPLAVSHQFQRESEKFGIPVHRVQDGRLKKGINVTNYERLDKFNPRDIALVAFDEGSRVKHADSKSRKLITEFASQVEYRILATATPAPNDFMELGCSSEALGYMTRNQMLAMFFTNDGETTQQWRLKGHAKKRFWQWVATWARACRKPSDLGFPDDGFILPELRTHSHVIPSNAKRKGFFPDLAVTLEEQREEKSRTYKERCNKVASLVPGKRVCLIYCQLNKESEYLTKIIPGAVEVTGSQRDEEKEELLIAFQNGEIPVLVTKPKIAGHGLNLQVCNWLAYFPTHSHELYYQAIRRAWRYGQKNIVDCNLISTEREKLVLSNMLRKERQSDELFSGIIREMYSAISYQGKSKTIPMELPTWLKSMR